jgi:hypothetical protein
MWQVIIVKDKVIQTLYQLIQVSVSISCQIHQALIDYSLIMQVFLILTQVFEIILPSNTHDS